MTDSAPEGEPQARRWTTKRWIIVGGAAVAVVLAAVITLVVVLRANSREKPDQLAAMLLDAAEINTIMGATDMQRFAPADQPAQNETELSNPECLGALVPGEAPTYASSGYTDMRWVAAKELNGPIQHYARQAVVRFPTADKANAFVQSSEEQWKACAEQTITTAGASDTWVLGTPTGEPPSIALLEHRTDARGWSTQRVMRAVSNVVIDVSASGYDITDQGNRIADQIASRVPR